MYWQRWKAHGDRGSLAGRIKDPSVDDFTIWIFLETQNIFMAWETIWRYKQKAYSGDFMAALSQQWSTSEGNWEFERGFFSRLSNSKREITLAAHGHQVIWCPGHSRWCRKLQALHGITEEYTSSPLEGKYRESDQGWLIPLRLFFFYTVSPNIEFSWCECGTSLRRYYHSCPVQTFIPLQIM